jgi:hypothetical protein
MQRTISRDYTAESEFLGEFNRWCNARTREVNIVDGKMVGVKTIDNTPVLVDHLLTNDYIQFYGKMFNHYNLLRPDHSDYYRRCIYRFYDVLENTDPKLFLFMFVDKKTYVDEQIDQKINRMYATNVEDILQFEKEFRKYTDNYKIICIFQIIDDEIRVLLILNPYRKVGGNYFLDSEKYWHY